MDRSLWFVGPGQVELRASQLDPVGDEEVRVRTICSGISAGTELLAFRGELPADLAVDESLTAVAGTFTYPFRYGYSAVGEVEAIGRSVQGLACGDVVFAFHPHAECFVAANDELLPLSGLEPRLAVLLPYVETALQITIDAGPVFGEPVVVCGLGVLGVLVSCLMQRAGADVIGIEPQAWRRAAAAELGIAAVDPHDAAVPSEGVPLAIECSGNPAALASVLGLLGHEGTALVASWYGTKPVTLPLGGDFHRRRLTIRSTQVSTIPAAASGRWDRRRRIVHARDLASSLPLAALASHTISFDRAADGYRLLDEGSEGVVHVAFGYR